MSLYCHPVYGQPAMDYIERLTTGDGLSSNEVNDILQDPDGYLWVATQNGLNRYDGSEVEKYFEGNDSGSLSGNIIYRLLLLDSSHIAVATNKGLSVLDLKKDSIKRITFPSDSLLWPYDNQLTFMERDTAGNIWIGTPSAVYRLNAQLKVQKKFISGLDFKDLEATRNSYVFKIVTLLSGEVLFWLQDGVYQWLPGKDLMVKIEKTGFPMGSLSSNTSYFHAFGTKGGHFIFVNYHTGRIEIYDEKTKDSTSYLLTTDVIPWSGVISHVSELPGGVIVLSFNDNKGSVFLQTSPAGRISARSDGRIYLPEFICGKWICDSEQNYWVTTRNAGLIKIAQTKQRFAQTPFRKETSDKTSGFEFASVLKTGNRLFIATFGDGFYVLDITTGKIVHENVRLKGYHENMIWNFRRHSKDTLWLGMQQGLMWYNTRTRTMGAVKQKHPGILDSFAITMQFTDSRGMVWMGVGSGKGLAMYDPAKNIFTLYRNNPNEYPYRYPLAAGEDAQSNLWFISDATPNLVKYIRKENRFQKIVFPFFKGRSAVQTGALFVDIARNTVWYGVGSNGLVRYDIQSGKTKIYGLKSGLGTDKIYSIEEDGRRMLWLSTTQGLTFFNPEKEKFINYDQSDGLTETNLTGRLYFDSASGIMYTGSSGKIIKFSPADFRKEKQPMKVLLTRLMINNEPAAIPQDRKLTLPWNKNNIAISFSGINLTNGNENIYAYKTSDNSEWIDIGAQRQVQFASLNPGHYHFLVKAARKDREWSYFTDYLDIYIKPPFYNTPWFYILCLLVAGGAVYGWYKYRLAQWIRLQTMRSTISHDLHDEIGSRLTNINMMSQIAEGQNTGNAQEKSLLQKIREESEEISQSMREIIWNIDPENDSMEEALPRMLRFASDLLESKHIVLQAYIPDSFDVKINMEKRRDLFLIFKEAIHNIVKHSEATQVLLKIKYDEKNNMELRLIDNGKGFIQGGLTYENGLRYMRMRAEKHQWLLRIISDPLQGTEVLLQMKLK